MAALVTIVYGDGCPRQHPLSPVHKQQVPDAFKRYGVVTDLIPSPPSLLLEVGLWVTRTASHSYQRSYLYSLNILIVVYGDPSALGGLRRY